VIGGHLGVEVDPPRGDLAARPARRAPAAPGNSGRPTRRVRRRHRPTTRPGSLTQCGAPAACGSWPRSLPAHA
jgi:hypothetical protein